MRVQVGNGRLFFDVEGLKLVPEGPAMRERPTLILLHGGPGGDHSYFKPAMSALADVAQVIYLDHRSQGRSDSTSNDRWNLASWADDIVAFCAALEIERPVVMGTSFGGMVAMEYAARHPAHPSKLILCSTTARWVPERVYQEFERLGGPAARAAAIGYWESPGVKTAAQYLRVCMPLYTRTAPGRDAFARTLWKFEVGFFFASGEQRTMNLLPGLARIQCPTLVLAGEDDPITPLASSQEIAEALPAGLVRFERFANAGHGIVDDARERALAAIREFITG